MASQTRSDHRTVPPAIVRHTLLLPINTAPFGMDTLARTVGRQMMIFVN